MSYLLPVFGSRGRFIGVRAPAEKHGDALACHATPAPLYRLSVKTTRDGREQTRHGVDVPRVR